MRGSLGFKKFEVNEKYEFVRTYLEFCREVENYHNYIGSVIAMYRTSVTNDSQFNILQGEALVCLTLQG